MSLHGICPVGPDRTGYPDTPSNMKKGMDGQWTGRKPSRIIFVVQPISTSVIDTREEKRGLTFHIPPPTTGNPRQFDSTLLPIS